MSTRPYALYTWYQVWYFPDERPSLRALGPVWGTSFFSVSPIFSSRLSAPPIRLAFILAQPNSYY